MTDDETATAETDYADYSDETATFGDRIVAAREAMGMTAAQLARRMGVKTQTLQGWEEDRSEPRANKLQMLSGILNVSIIWLMSGEGPGLRQPRSGLDAPDVDALIEELREIRALQFDLATRTQRLERHLLSLSR